MRTFLHLNSSVSLVVKFAYDNVIKIIFIDNQIWRIDEEDYDVVSYIRTISKSSLRVNSVNIPFNTIIAIILTS